MEKTIKIVAITLGVLALIVFIPFVCLRYTTRYKEKLVDKTSSPDIVDVFGWRAVLAIWRCAGKADTGNGK
jgi:hypothetical protein